EVLELGRRRHFGDGADGDVLVGAVERTRRAVEGDGGEGIADVGDGEPEAGQLHLVDVDLENVALGPVDLHVGDAGHGCQAFGDDVVDQRRQVLLGQGVGGDGDLDDGAGVGIRLEDGGVVGVVGQAAGQPAGGVADIGGGVVEVGAVGEGEGDAAAAVGGARGDGGNALHPRDR